MTTKQIKQLGDTVGFVVSANKGKVVSLLRNNGVSIPDSASDELLISLVIEKVFSDQKFNKGFDSLSKSTANSYLKAIRQTPNASYSNLTGFDFDSTATTQPLGSTGSSFDWGGLASGILGAGTSIFGQINATNAQKKLAEQQAKTAKLNADTAIAQANAQLEIERLRLAQIQANKAGGGNTMVYVGVGLAGLIVVGALVFAFRKK